MHLLIWLMSTSRQFKLSVYNSQLSQRLGRANAQFVASRKTAYGLASLLECAGLIVTIAPASTTEFCAARKKRAYLPHVFEA